MKNELANLYARYFAAPGPLAAFGAQCSSPLLIGTKHLQHWEECGQRILVVGQETLGWNKGRSYSEWFGDSESAAARIAALRELYDTFDFSEGEHGKKHKNSPFWQAFRSFRKPGYSAVLWSNIFRMSIDAGSVMGNAKNYPGILDAMYRTQQGLLTKEIDILKPTAILFFTGPHYDAGLCREFGDVAFTAHGDIDSRIVARLTNGGVLDGRVAYRTYHPNYLRRDRRWNIIETLQALTLQAR